MRLSASPPRNQRGYLRSLETTTGSTDLTLLQEGQVNSLSVSNGGSGYKVGDTLILSTSGEAGGLSDGSVDIGGSKTFVTVTVEVSFKVNVPPAQSASRTRLELLLPPAVGKI